MSWQKVLFPAALAALGLAATFALLRLAIGAAPQAAQADIGAKPRNLKVLPNDISPADLIELMARYSQELGVQCQFCHAEGPQGIDFVSDQSPAKQTARVMIAMLSDINNKYLAEIRDQRYSVPLTCGNCHLGQTTPPVYEPRP